MINIAFIRRENIHWYLSADITCSKMRIIFRERSSRKTEIVEEQIMFMDKYTSIFSRNLGAIVVIILQIFCNLC